MLDQVKINNKEILNEILENDYNKKQVNDRVVEVLNIEYWINKIRVLGLLNSHSIDILNSKAWHCNEKFNHKNDCKITILDKNNNSICSLLDLDGDDKLKLLYVSL